MSNGGIMTLQEMNAAILDLMQRVTALEAAGPKKPAPGTLQKGKYAGKTAESIVERDPRYIVWLHEKRLAAGIGFTLDQVDRAAVKLAAAEEAAKQNTMKRPDEVAKVPGGTRQQPYNYRRPDDDIDDGISF